MEAQSFVILCRLIDGQLTRIQTAFERAPEKQRGATYVTFVRLHLDAIQDRLAAAQAGFDQGSAAEKKIHSRSLLRFKYLIDLIHGNVFNYRRDIGRQDLPVGLLHLVDALLGKMIKDPTDPIIHSQGEYMYSTIRLKDQWAPLSSELGVDWKQPVEPIILNLPGLDPDNALMSPILAHEVGHSVVDHNKLRDAVAQRLDQQLLSESTQKLQAADPAADVPALLGNFGNWVDEFLCDALATELTGPSMLFASAAFLPASSAGMASATHPDPADRLQLSMRQLDAMGWVDPLRMQFPAVMEWLSEVAAPGPEVSDHQLQFLRELTELAFAPVAEVAREHLEHDRLMADSYLPTEAKLNALVERGIPPTEIDGEPTPPWNIILSCWMRGLRLHGDSSDGIARTTLDTSLSRFALRSVEMSRVLELWRLQ